jgi:hypothetical protein
MSSASKWQKNYAVPLANDGPLTNMIFRPLQLSKYAIPSGARGLETAIGLGGFQLAPSQVVAPCHGRTFQGEAGQGRAQSGRYIWGKQRRENLLSDSQAPIVHSRLVVGRQAVEPALPRIRTVSFFAAVELSKLPIEHRGIANTAVNAPLFGRAGQSHIVAVDLTLRFRKLS